MALKIRLSRGGAKKRPFYRIVVADSRNPRDGRFIERVGTYNPLLPKDSSERVKLNVERIRYWLGTGARPTDRVARFLGAAELIEVTRHHNPNKGQPGAKAVERKAAQEEARKAAQEAAANAPEPAPEPEAEPAPESEAEPEASQAPSPEATAEPAAEPATEPTTDTKEAADKEAGPEDSAVAATDAEPEQGPAANAAAKEAADKSSDGAQEDGDKA